MSKLCHILMTSDFWCPIQTEKCRQRKKKKLTKLSCVLESDVLLPNTQNTKHCKMSQTISLSSHIWLKKTAASLV